MDRRNLLKAIGSVGIVGLAGCTSGEEEKDQEQQTTMDMNPIPDPDIEWSGKVIEEELPLKRVRVKVYIQMNDADKLYIRRNHRVIETVTQSGAFLVAGEDTVDGYASLSDMFSVAYSRRKSTDTLLSVSTYAAVDAIEEYESEQ